MTMAPGGFLALCWRGIDILLAGQRAEGLGKERAEPHLLSDIPGIAWLGSWVPKASVGW